MKKIKEISTGITEMENPTVSQPINEFPKFEQNKE